MTRPCAAQRRLIREQDCGVGGGGVGMASRVAEGPRGAAACGAKDIPADAARASVSLRRVTLFRSAQLSSAQLINTTSRLHGPRPRAQPIFKSLYLHCLSGYIPSHPPHPPSSPLPIVHHTPTKHPPPKPKHKTPPKHQRSHIQTLPPPHPLTAHYSSNSPSPRSPPNSPPPSPPQSPPSPARPLPPPHPSTNSPPSPASPPHPPSASG